MILLLYYQESEDLKIHQEPFIYEESSTFICRQEFLVRFLPLVTALFAQIKMIDAQTYRVRIGLFGIKQLRSSENKEGPFQQESNAIGLALIVTLLVIGGIEQNPGPSSGDDSLPGPSFAGASLMDVMEAIRLTQFQIENVSRKVDDLAELIAHGQNKAATHTCAEADNDQLAVSDQQPSSRCLETRAITTPAVLPGNGVHRHPGAEDERAAPRVLPDTGAHRLPGAGAVRAAPRVLPNTGSQRLPGAETESGEVTHAEQPTPPSLQHPRQAGIATLTSKVGAVMLGCQNVRRIAAAARDEFLLNDNIVFKALAGGTARCVLGALRGAVASCTALKADLVLHVGGNDLSSASAEYTTDCIYQVIEAAKRLGKVREIFVCSVPQDLTMSHNILNWRQVELNDNLHRLCEATGARFVDLRPRLNDCPFQGLDRSRLNLNRSGARNAWQLLAGEVNGFLD